MPEFRKILPHVPPAFVPAGSWFFITICGEERGTNQLCLSNTSNELLTDGIFYHERRKWILHLLLLMPDHLHLIAAFPPGETMSSVIRDWKRLTTRRIGIRWQRNYFDHRVRPDEGLQQKTNYIRANPVRAGLTQHPDDWPHFVDYRTLEGR